MDKRIDMLATHIDAENRYQKLRETALQAAQQNFQEFGLSGIKATTITPSALVAVKTWNNSRDRKVDWDWRDGYGVFRYRYPKRFEIALWKTTRLIGISMGRPTYNGSSLRLDIVEASPRELGDRPKVIPLVLASYAIYAHLINASEIRIMNPINTEVKNYYESFGYKYLNRNDYLYMKL